MPPCRPAGGGAGDVRLTPPEERSQGAVDCRRLPRVSARQFRCPGLPPGWTSRFLTRLSALPMPISSRSPKDQVQHHHRLSTGHLSGTVLALARTADLCLVSQLVIFETEHLANPCDGGGDRAWSPARGVPAHSRGPRAGSRRPSTGHNGKDKRSMANDSATATSAQDCVSIIIGTVEVASTYSSPVAATGNGRDRLAMPELCWQETLDE